MSSMMVCDPIFNPGDLVVLKSDPTQMGAVTNVQRASPQFRYDIWIGDKTRSFYADQLLPHQASVKSSFITIPFEEFQARLSAIHLAHPSQKTLYSLNAARVDFIPYQFRPVLKFMRSDKPRLLIADEVGVGKTIEAGLILRELQARQRIDFRDRDEGVADSQRKGGEHPGPGPNLGRIGRGSAVEEHVETGRVQNGDAQRE